MSSRIKPQLTLTTFSENKQAAFLGDDSGMSLAGGNTRDSSAAEMFARHSCWPEPISRNEMAKKKIVE